MRKFVYDGREFPDSDPDLTPDQVRQSLTAFFPELANAEIQERKEGDDDVFEFRRRVGTKGADSIVEVIGSVPSCRLTIIDLVNELTTPAGLDYEAAQKRQDEVNLAVAEADRHIKGTREAIDRLWELPPRAWSG